MKERVAILSQGFIPVYRAKFYELLNRASSKEYVVYHGTPPSNTGLREFQGFMHFPNVKIRNIEIPLLGKTFIYQCAVTRIVCGSYDAIVLGDAIRFVSTLLLFALCKMARRPVIWWGHGFAKPDESGYTGRMLFPLVSLVKKYLARLGDMYIVYTDRGGEMLVQSGVRKERIGVIRNTIDMEEQFLLSRECADVDSMELRQKMNLRLDSKVLLYVGRLYTEKKVEDFLYLVKRINEEGLCGSPVEGVIIGTGPECERLEEMGKKSEWLHFVGELYDQRAIAEYMRVASAVVIPGKVGLAVNHAFSQGVPVITRENEYHAPEVEYIVQGENGLIIEGDFENFVRATVEYLNSAGCQKRMADGALKTGYTLRMEFMVKAFDEAVSRAINQKARKSGSDNATADAQ